MDFQPSGDIVSIKLITGEEIVAKYIAEVPEGYLVTKPRLHVYDPVGVVFRPWMGSVLVNDVMIRKEHVVIITNTGENAAKSFTTRFLS